MYPPNFRETYCAEPNDLVLYFIAVPPLGRGLWAVFNKFFNAGQTEDSSKKVFELIEQLLQRY